MSTGRNSAGSENAPLPQATASCSTRSRGTETEEGSSWMMMIIFFSFLRFLSSKKTTSLRTFFLVFVACIHVIFCLFVHFFYCNPLLILLLVVSSLFSLELMKIDNDLSWRSIFCIFFLVTEEIIERSFSSKFRESA